jgi:hypothetical protein
MVWSTRGRSAAAWQPTAGEDVKRSPLTRRTPLAGGSTLKRTPLKAGKPKRRRKQPAEVLAAIAKRSGGRCIVCRAKCDPRRDRHHVLPVQTWPELELVAANQILVCLDDHMAHEGASRRIRMAELPACAITLAHATSGAAVVYLERTYR